MLKRYLAGLALAAAAFGTVSAQDAKAVIASAQKALGDVKSITYSGSAKDVSFQQCGANSTDMSPRSACLFCCSSCRNDPSSFWRVSCSARMPFF